MNHLSCSNGTQVLGLFLLFVLTIFPACSTVEPVVITNPPSTERGYLVSYAKTGSMTAAV